MTRPRTNPLETLEIELLLEAIYRHSGYDFREYAYASMRRRIAAVVASEGLASISALQDRVLHDPAGMRRLILALSVNVTSMFRDPAFFRALRERVVPMLRTYPFVRLWHAGCSTGEEVYSTAILLEEEWLSPRCRIYATDIDDGVLAQAREGIYPLSAMKQYEEDYEASGGRGRLSDFYTSGYGSAIMRSSLRDNIVFSEHNLAMDGSFNEFHVILCRNVMIYFSRALQQRVHHLLHGSLALLGVLGLGAKETLHLTPFEKAYEELVAGTRLYRRIA